MNVLDFKLQIDSGKIDKLYIFTGAEKGMMDIYIKKLKMTPMRVNSFKEVKSKLSVNTLFTKSSLYIISNDDTIVEEFAVAKNKDMLLKTIGQNKVILMYDTIDKRKAFFKTFAKNIVEFNKMDCATLYNLVSKNLNISRQLSDILCIRSNMDVNKILLECDKLKCLNVEITKEILDELVTPLPEDVVFDMINAIARNKINLAFELWEDLKYYNESPIKVISLLYRNIRNIFLIQSYKDLKNEDIAAKTGLSIGQVWHTKEIINCFTLQQLVNMLMLLHETEVSIKTGKLPIDLSVDYILLHV